jgi:DnaJ-class molecular chaperone
MTEKKPHPPTHHPGQGAMNPGDQAPEGTPGTGGALCPDCSGKGRLGDEECPTCGGTGKVIEGVSGA